VAGAEVDQPGAAVRVAHQDSVALHVTVNGVGGMEGSEGARQLSQELAELLGGGSVLLCPGIEGRTFHPVHDEEGILGSGGVAKDSPVQQARNAGVAQAGEQLRLAGEARIPREEGELEGDGA
jgi:hypothetical protein